MENITVSLTNEKIEEAVLSAVDELCKSTYSNPIRTVLEDSLSDKKGEIKKVVDSIIVEAISSPDFRNRLADVVVQRMVQTTLK